MTRRPRSRCWPRRPRLAALAVALVCCIALIGGPARAAVSWKRLSTVGGTLTANQMCYTDGTNVLCDSNAPTLLGGNVGIGTTAPGSILSISSTTPTITVTNTTNQNVDYGRASQITLVGTNGGGVTHNVAQIQASQDADNTEGFYTSQYAGRISFSVERYDASTMLEVMRVDPTGVYTTGSLPFVVSNGSAGTGLYNNYLNLRGDAAGNYSFINWDTPNGRMQVANVGNNGVEITTSAGVVLTATSTGNVGIGTTAPNTNALLDVFSTTKGLLPPRLTTAQRTAIGTATLATGMMIYNTDLAELETYDGATYGWEAVGAYGAIAAGTTGQIQFNTAGDLNADSNFFWDNASKRLGVGTTAPGALFTVGNNTFEVNAGGTVTATTFSGAHTGNGAGLTGIGTASLTAITGTASSSTFLRGDGTWATAGGGLTWPLAGAADSVSAPDYAWIGHTNTGLYFNTGIGFAVGGNNIATIAATGLGIGTTAPMSLFEMTGYYGSELWGFSDSSGPGSNYGVGGIGFNVIRNGETSSWNLGTDSANNGGGFIDATLFGSLRFFTVDTTGGTAKTLTDAQMMATERMEIDSTGVGIGTKGPQNLLDVNGAASVGYNVAAPTNGLLVKGTVGIGTVTPLANVEVNGNVNLLTEPLLDLNSTNTGATVTAPLLEIKDNATSAYSGAVLSVDNASGNLFTVSNNGNVVVGTASNSNSLTVSATKNSQVLSLNNTFSTTSGYSTGGLATALSYVPASTSTAFVYGDASTITPNSSVDMSGATLMADYGSVTIAAGNTGNIGTITGVEGYLGNSGSGSVTNSIGVYGDNWSLNGTTNAYGVEGEAGAGNTAITGTNAWGGYFATSIGTTGTTMVAGYGVEGLVSNRGTMTTAYGGYFDINTAGSGVTTTGYGVYISSIAATTKYSLYASDSTAPSYFAGNVGIGTTTPATGMKVDIAGPVKIAGTGSESCTAAQVGAMRYNPTGNYFELCSYP